MTLNNLPELCYIDQMRFDDEKQGKKYKFREKAWFRGRDRKDFRALHNAAAPIFSAKKENLS
jgi:hypothetical protein